MEHKQHLKIEIIDQDYPCVISTYAIERDTRDHTYPSVRNKQ
jgi:hypothetical protein